MIKLAFVGAEMKMVPFYHEAPIIVALIISFTYAQSVIVAYVRI